MTTYLTYLHLLTALHTGGSADEGNLMGIAREVHTEFPYLPSSSVRGKIRSELEQETGAGIFFGQKIQGGQQPTEGEVWFADAALLFFPIASLSHHLLWITCPLWLERWQRWLDSTDLQALIQQCRETLSEEKPAVVSFTPEALYLQTAILKQKDLVQLNNTDALTQIITPLTANSGLLKQLPKKLVIISDEDCLALVETGLQREVRVALKEEEKMVKDGSFRSEEAIPPETILFFPWGMKPSKQSEVTQEVRQKLLTLLKGRLQFGGLEGLGRGWTNLTTKENSSS